MREFFSNSNTSLGIDVDFKMIAEAIRFRPVSVSSDEPLLVGNLLGLDVSKVIAHESAAESMRLLWTLMPNAINRIPASIIFWVGPRLDMADFRWAPATLLLPSSINLTLGLMETSKNHGNLTVRGPYVFFPGWRISLPERPQLFKPMAKDIIQSKRKDFFFI